MAESLVAIFAVVKSEIRLDAMERIGEGRQDVGKRKATLTQAAIALDPVPFEIHVRGLGDRRQCRQQ